MAARTSITLQTSREYSKDIPPSMESDSEKPNASFQNDFPEGGKHGWLTVAGASACLFVSFGWVNCVGIFQEYYQTHQLKEYTASEIAWIPSLQVFFMIFSGVFVGKIYDDYGPRPLLLAGTVFHVFGLMMASLAKTYYQILLSQAICSAIGASMVFYPSFTTVSTWFLANRGAAMGLVVSGSSLGGVIFPIMLIHLIPEVGFPWAMRICAFLILALLSFANATMRSRVPPTKRPFEIMALFRPFKERTFLLLTAAVFFFYWGMFIPITFIVEHAIAHGMSSHLANYLVPILNGASIFGRTIPNALADKVGHFNVMIVMSGFTAILILALWLPATGNAAIIVFAALFGIGSGAGVGLTPALCAKISPLQEIGTRTGAAFSISAFAALTGSPIGGKLIADQHGSFKYAIVFGGICCAIGTMLFVAARASLVGMKLAKM
ncbi:unnamed protein product [Penicillium glandicola]